MNTRAVTSSRLLGALVAACITCAASGAAARDVINLQGADARRALDELQSLLKADPTNAEANKAAGILLHQSSRRSPEKTQVEQGEQYLKQARLADPKDAETLAWLGSITTMKALFETDPGRQTLYVKLGTRSIDGAVAQAPDNLVVRLIRASNSIELPPFLKRSRYAIEDYQHYLALCARQDCPPQEVSAARQNLEVARKLTAEAM